MRRLALTMALLAGTAFVPAAEAAVIPGPNGPLVFTSGRDDGATVLANSRAQIWFLAGPGGGATRLSTLELSHYRHASWSPDRTKIAYARGPDDPDFNGPWDIFVQNLTNPAAAPVQITNTMLNEDRPSWSPDGTRLAYAKVDPVDSNWDVVTKAADGTGTETLVADLASTGAQGSGQFSRPQWSPDGQTIFYGKVIVAAPPAAVDYDIYRAAADGSDQLLGGTPVVTGSTNDYQPALSADGTKLCFSRQGANKDVYVHPGLGTMAVPVALDTAGTDEYECAWSPDGTKIAFVRGAFGAGHILMKNSDASGNVDPMTNDALNNRFDGNPEWTRNPPPTCSNGTASVAFNGFVRIPLSCADDRDPPAFEDNQPELQIATGPPNGTLSGIQPDRSVIYTPKANFQGTDSFTITGNDQTTTSALATVTVTVAGPGADPPATISDVSVSPRRWRRGPDLPSFSALVGARIQWRLSEPARVTLTFQRGRPGRRVGGRCVTPTRARRARPRCTRFVRVRPSLTRTNANAGLNTLLFQGRLSPTRRLGLGVHRVVLGAVDATGHRSKSVTSRTFKIVAR